MASQQDILSLQELQDMVQAANMQIDKVVERKKSTISAKADAHLREREEFDGLFFSILKILPLKLGSVHFNNVLQTLSNIKK